MRPRGRRALGLLATLLAVLLLDLLLDHAMPAARLEQVDWWKGRTLAPAQQLMAATSPSQEPAEPPSLQRRRDLSLLEFKRSVDKRAEDSQPRMHFFVYGRDKKVRDSEDPGSGDHGSGDTIPPPPPKTPSDAEEQLSATEVALIIVGSLLGFGIIVLVLSVLLYCKLSPEDSKSERLSEQSAWEGWSWRDADKKSGLLRWLSN